MNKLDWQPGPYWEHLELLLQGTFLSPEKASGRSTVLSILGDRNVSQNLNAPDKSDWKPLGVGTLTSRGDRTEYLGSLPQDSLWYLMNLLSIGKVRMVDLYGESLFRGKAMIQTIRFAPNIDPDDW